MKVSELIEQLQQLDGDLTVFVSGYEDGYNIPESVSDVANFKKVKNPSWYNGEYDATDGDDYDLKGVII